MKTEDTMTTNVNYDPFAWQSPIKRDTLIEHKTSIFYKTEIIEYTQVQDCSRKCEQKIAKGTFLLSMLGRVLVLARQMHEGKDKNEHEASDSHSTSE